MREKGEKEKIRMEEGLEDLWAALSKSAEGKEKKRKKEAVRVFSCVVTQAGCGQRRKEDVNCF